MGPPEVYASGRLLGEVPAGAGNHLAWNTQVPYLLHN